MDISQFKCHHNEVVYYDDYAFLDSLSTEERQKYLPQDIAGADEAELNQRAMVKPISIVSKNLSCHILIADKLEIL